MQIDIGINPNCSEATLRIALDGQDMTKVDQLVDKLKSELADTYGSAPELPQWDDDKTGKEFDWSEATVDERYIFGMHVLEIDGDAPYNFGDEINKVVDRYIPDAKREFTE